jgi:hypothetical protein
MQIPQRQLLKISFRNGNRRRRHSLLGGIRSNNALCSMVSLSEPNSSDNEEKVK